MTSLFYSVDHGEGKFFLGSSLVSLSPFPMLSLSPRLESNCNRISFIKKKMKVLTMNYQMSQHQFKVFLKPAQSIHFCTLNFDPKKMNKFSVHFFFFLFIKKKNSTTIEIKKKLKVKLIYILFFSIHFKTWFKLQNKFQLLADFMLQLIKKWSVFVEGAIQN